MSSKAMLNMMQRDKVLRRDAKEVGEARKRLVAGGLDSKKALKKIKKVISKEIKGKMI